MLEVPDFDFIMPCGVVVFALFYCHLDLCCGEYYNGCFQFGFVLCVLCLTVLVNCLLNAFAKCVGEVSVLSLKVMVFCFWVVLVFC